ncbi:hypothetical protein KDK_28670 [Dictyobacter kobayashii]|uniref:Uncharacterized protein n=1 Tax=Dictyobacter kobayashii TaxID=2014872 RepID=A0A402AIX2_9CHLR|nr:hypothetical protein KDK_28670 [Dictyobacter kobayashii]
MHSTPIVFLSPTKKRRFAGFAGCYSPKEENKDPYTLSKSLRRAVKGYPFGNFILDAGETNLRNLQTCKPDQRREDPVVTSKQ